MSNVLEVVLNLIDNLSPGLGVAADAVDNLGNSVENTSNGLDNFDPSNIKDLGQAASDAGLDLQQVGEAAAMAGYDISSIDPTPVKETSEGANEAAGAGEEMAASFSAVDGVLSALIGVGIGAFLDSIVDKAMGAVDSWNLLNSVLNQNGVNNEQAKAQIIELANTHGFLTSQVRDSTKFFMQAGMTYQDVTKDQGALEAAMAISVATGQDLTSASSTLQRAYMGQGRQLKLLGIDLNDYKDATTGAVDKEALHAAILQQLGTQLDTHATSYEAMMTRMENATGKLEVAMGKMLLPILTPIVEGITWLIDSFLALPAPIKDIILGVTTFAATIAALGLTLGPVITMLGGAVTSTLGLFGIEMGGAALAAGALEVAMGPVGWAILAITAAVAAAIFIWQNWSDEIVKFKDNLLNANWGAAASQIGDSFNYIGDAIYSALVNAGQQIWTFFAGLPAWIGENYTAWLNMGRDFLLWIVQGLTSLSSYLSTTLTEMMTAMATDGSSQAAGTTAGQSTGKGIIDGLKQWLIDNGPLIGQTLVLIFQQLLPLIGAIFLQMGAIVAVWVYQEAIKAGQRFINGFLQMLAQLPGLVLVGLIQTVLTIAMWGYQVWSYALWAGSMLVQGFVSWLSQLPGIAWMYFLAFLNYLGQLPGIAYGYAASTGNAIVSAIGSYLAGLPGQMYSWGMSALSSFVNGVINAIPGLRAALDTVRSLFPASPPKEGPLSEIKAENMESWMRGILDAGTSVWGDFTIGDNILSSGGSASLSGSNGNNATEINLNIDLKNVPEGNSDKGISDQLINGIKDRRVLDVLNVELNKVRTGKARSRGV